MGAVHGQPPRGDVDEPVTGGSAACPPGVAGGRAGWVRRACGSSFVRAVGATVATRAFTILASLVTSVIVARALGPSGRGVFAVAIAVSAIGVQFGNLGLHASNTYAVARDRSLVGALAANSLVVSVVLGVLTAAATAVVARFAPAAVPLDGATLALTLLTIPVGLAVLLLHNLLLGVADVTGFNMLELLTRGTVLVLTAGVIAAGAVSVEAALAAGLAAAMLSAAAAFVRLRRHFPALPRPSLVLLRDHIGYGARAYVAALLSFLVLRVGLFMVQHILGAEAAGHFAIAVSLGDMLYIIPAVVGTLLFPRLAALPDDAARRAAALRAAGAMAALMAALVVVAMVLARPLILLLYGAEFEPAVGAFVWLAPAIGLLAVQTVVMNHFAAAGMPPVTMLLPLGALVLSVALHVVLVPRLGLRGAALAAVLVYAAMAVVALSVMLWPPRAAALQVTRGH